MKKYILTYGLIIGLIITGSMIYSVYQCCNDPNYESNDVLGYIVMVIVFLLLFFGIRNFRNKEQSGFITIGKAFKIGFLIAAVASTMYVVVWLFYYYLFVPDFMDKYISHVLKEFAETGATSTEMAEKTMEMDKLREMYKNPFLVILISYMEVFPVGTIVALISALILKRKVVVVNQ